MSRASVLVAAGGAPWEPSILEMLAGSAPGVSLLRRCVDVRDLLAHAAIGQGTAVLIAEDLPGLDADTVAALHRCRLTVVVLTESGVTDDPRLTRLGVDAVLPVTPVSGVIEAVSAPAPDGRHIVAPVPARDSSGRLLAVWGPAGAPGRTTLAVGIAAELAHRDAGVLLMDVDPYGGAVAQHLGVLDEASGLLASARMGNAGVLDADRLAATARQLGPRLRLLTGLPRADRWVEVRDAAFEQLLDAALALEPWVVADTGFSLEDDPTDPFGGTAARRNAMTLLTLERAAAVVVVGSADPVGLARLVRGLVELGEVVPGATLQVVVNRTRASLGWREQDVAQMVEDFVTPAGLHFLPEDQRGADKALLGGRTLVECGDSPLRRAVGRVVDALAGAVPAGRSRGRLRV